MIGVECFDEGVMLKILSYTDTAADMRAFFACNKASLALRDSTFLLENWLVARTRPDLVTLLSSAVTHRRHDQLDILLTLAATASRYFSDYELSAALHLSLILGSGHGDVTSRIMPLCHIQTHLPADEEKLLSVLDRSPNGDFIDWVGIAARIDLSVYGANPPIFLRLKTYSVVMNNVLYMIGNEDLDEADATHHVTLMVGAPVRPSNANLRICRLASGSVCIHFQPASNASFLCDCF